MKTFKRILLALLSGAMLLSYAGCAGEVSTSEESDEEISAADEEEAADEEAGDAQLNIEDIDYYTRFRNDHISLNVFNWGEYISDGADEGTLDVNLEFEKLTGIKVNYTNFSSNEELYAKMHDGAVSYDIIIPSDYMIAKLIKEGMIQKLDYSNIPNYRYIMDNVRGLEYDPNEEYSVPYTWGTVVLIYNKEVVGIEEDDIDWDILWNEDYRDDILMFDNERDAFAIAQIMQGISVNSEDPEELQRAADFLKEQKPLVQAYVMDEVFDKMEGGEATIAPYYIGDALTITAANEDLTYAIPKSGTNLFVDAMCIPSNAKQKEAAEMYINFMNEPDIAFANIDYICYATPNSAAYEMLDDEVRDNPLLYPDEELIREKTQVFSNLSDEATELKKRLWIEMKSAEDENSNIWLVPVFIIISLIFVAVIQTRRHIKTKRENAQAQ